MPANTKITNKRENEGERGREEGRRVIEEEGRRVTGRDRRREEEREKRERK